MATGGPSSVHGDYVTVRNTGLHEHAASAVAFAALFIDHSSFASLSNDHSALAALSNDFALADFVEIKVWN